MTIPRWYRNMTEQRKRDALLSDLDCTTGVPDPPTTPEMADADGLFRLDTDDQGYMHSDADGPYVRYEKAKALLAEIEKLKAEIELLRSCFPPVTQEGRCKLCGREPGCDRCRDVEEMAKPGETFDFECISCGTHYERK